MKIILSQRIDTVSSYQDIPFSRYHFPKRYINQIQPGDQFIYYQGNKSIKDQRYYFGCGVVGNIESDIDGEYFFAEILDGIQFTKKVPIYLNETHGYLESLGYSEVRTKVTPPWQSSIRKLSDEAYLEILRRTNIESSINSAAWEIESQTDPLRTLITLNERLRALSPNERSSKAQAYLDRGSSVTKALKKLLGAKCQICEWEGFLKKKSNNKEADNFIEAHHLTQISEQQSGSLCTDNIILLCPNCHREIHYGSKFSATLIGDLIEIQLSNHKKILRKNSIQHLRTIFEQKRQKTNT
jgi:hypothetical protein